MKHRPSMDNFLSTDIYGITADEYSLGRGNVETVRLIAESGIKVYSTGRRTSPPAGCMRNAWQ
jgi:thiamine-phosphate pyrophosphorylase